MCAGGDEFLNNLAADMDTDGPSELSHTARLILGLQAMRNKFCQPRASIRAFARKVSKDTDAKTPTTPLIHRNTPAVCRQR